jgi:putative flippase GtrA
MELLRRPSVRQFMRFGVVGFSSFLIDTGVFMLLTRLGGDYFLHAKTQAKFISFCVAATNSYIWNRCWTFRSRDPNRRRQLFQFFIVVGIGAALNGGIFHVLYDGMHIYDLIALVIATGIVMCWNFFMNRAWTFRCRPEETG